MRRQPLLSIVIPTRRRPQFLPKAINSALQSAPEGEVEVIVVPNGRDESWRYVASKYIQKPCVHWEPISTANANAARNRGKQISRGKYIRFLDDDDVLVPAGAKNQLIRIDAVGAELCSGSVDKVDESGRLMNHMNHANSDDLYVAMALENRLCLPLSHLFLRSSLNGFHWDETLNVEQDTDWMLRLASQREWHWRPIDDVVGQWTWHKSQRTSASISQHTRQKITAMLLIRCTTNLRARGALNKRRNSAYAEALWALAHGGFRHAPLFWNKVARLALKEDPLSRPPDPFYRNPLFRSVDPVMIEWLMIPKRALNDFMRKIYS